MAHFRIAIASDLTLLLKKSGLKALPWPPGRSAKRFAAWLFARKGPLTVNTTDLAEFVDEFLADTGCIELWVKDAKSVGKTIDSMNAQVTDVADAVRRIRCNASGEELITTLGRMATTTDLEQVIRNLDFELLGLLPPALDLLKRVTLPFIEGCGTLYKPGVSRTHDTLVAHHIVRLDKHLARHPPLDGSKDYQGAEVEALGQLSNNPETLAFVTEALMAARLAQESKDAPWQAPPPLRRQLAV